MLFWYPDSKGSCLNHLNHLMVDVLSKNIIFSKYLMKTWSTIELHYIAACVSTLMLLLELPAHCKISFTEKFQGENFPQKHLKKPQKCHCNQLLQSDNRINTASRITLKSQKAEVKLASHFSLEGWIWVIQGSPNVLHNSAVALLSRTAKISDQLNAVIKKAITAFIFLLIWFFIPQE